MIGDVLGCLHIQDVADGPLDHPLPDGRVERRVAQHVADRHFAIAAPRRSDELPHLLLVDRKRLFEEQVIARFQQRQRCGHVLVIHGAVDGEVGELRHARQRLGRLEAPVGAQIEHLRHQLSAQRRGIGYPDNLQLIGLALGVGGIHDGAMSRADDDCGGFGWHGGFLV